MASRRHPCRSSARARPAAATGRSPALARPRVPPARARWPTAAAGSNPLPACAARLSAWPPGRELHRGGRVAYAAAMPVVLTMEKLLADLRVLKWMVGLNLALGIVMLFKLADGLPAACP